VERELVAAARQGDKEAFATLARGRSDRLYAIAYRILRDPDAADDAVQQTLLTCWRELPRLRDLDRFGAWLDRIVVHACYAEARRSRRLVAIVRSLPRGESGPDHAISIADRDEIERAFSRLPVEQRAVLVLRHLLGMAPQEIARALEIPDGTARSRLHYAQLAMRAALEADGRPAVAGGPAR
jgi:RNA polymerase sigma-70 factor (ECF subfamily)